MIIVNYWLEEDNDPIDEFQIWIAGIINDTFDVHYDPELIIHAIANDNEFKPKEEIAYEIYLVRAQIASDPVDEPAFAIDRVIEKKL